MIHLFIDSSFSESGKGTRACPISLQSILFTLGDLSGDATAVGRRFRRVSGSWVLSSVGDVDVLREEN